MKPASAPPTTAYFNPRAYVRHNIGGAFYYTTGAISIHVPT